MNKSQINDTTVLERNLGLREAVLMTVGLVVGVGLFTVGANGVGMLGGMIIVSTLIALLISYWPALLYAEMGAMFPLAGGTYNYAQKGTNRPLATLAGWLYIAGAVTCTGGETLAFANYFGYLLKGLGLEIEYDSRVIAIIAALVFTVINFIGIKIAGRIQTGFMLFFWACAAVWFVMMAPEVEFANYQPIGQSVDIGGFIMITGLVWWCFAGFETVAGLGGEVKYPQVNIPRALMIAPLIIFAMTALFQWFLVGLVPAEFYDVLQVSEAPYAEGLISVGMLGIPLVVLCLGITFGGDMSTINPCIAGSSRYIYKMAKENVIPVALSKIHPRFHTPYVSVVIVGVAVILLVMTNSIIYIASVGLFSMLGTYIIAFIAYIGLKKRFPKIERPFKAPAGIIGAIISIVLYVVLMTQIGREAMITGIIYTAAVMALYFIRTKIFKAEAYEAETETFVLSEIEVPGKEEKRSMDRSFHWWLSLSIIAAAGAIALYIIAFLH